MSDSDKILVLLGSEDPGRQRQGMEIFGVAPQAVRDEVAERALAAGWTLEPRIDGDGLTLELGDRSDGFVTEGIVEMLALTHPKVTKVNLGWSDLEDRWSEGCLSFVSRAPELETLYVYGIRGVSSLNALWGHPTLSELTLSWCNALTEVRLQDLPMLTSLSFTHSESETACLEGCEGMVQLGLANMPVLTSLDLSGCWALGARAGEQAQRNRMDPVVGAGLPAFPGWSVLPELWHVSLMGCVRLRDEDLLALVNAAPGLRTLNIVGCARITDAGLDPLEQLEGLTELHLGALPECSWVAIFASDIDGLYSKESGRAYKERHPTCKVLWYTPLDDDGSAHDWIAPIELGVDPEQDRRT